MELFNYRFGDGTSLIVCDKKLGVTDTEVLTIQFNFMRGGQRKAIEAALYDADKHKDLGILLYEALCERYENVKTSSDTTSTIKTYKEKTCVKCGKKFLPAAAAQKTCLDCKK